MGFHWLNIIFLLLLVCWLVAFIHCIVNKGLRVGEKVAWIFALLFASWIGVPGYFVYWYGFARRRQKQKQMALPMRPSDVPSQQPGASSELICSPYEQGYRQPFRMQSTSQDKPFVVEDGEQEEVPPLYEQSLVMYPEHPE